MQVLPNKKNLLLVFSLLFASILPEVAYTQEEGDSASLKLTSSVREILDLPIKNNIGVEMFSASKQKETAFEAPLTSYVITHEDLRQNAITSIPEALRLVPGMIVRETGNGIYDVHIRGLGNIPPYGSLQNTMAAGVLLLIDNRPVYNHLNGGIFWETIPIALQDVEQIEVVQGATTTLYGSNAFTGVINIITKKPKGEKVKVYSDSYVGNYDTFVHNTSLTYQLSSKLALTASTNLQNRRRTDEEFYKFSAGTYLPFDSLQTEIDEIGIAIDPKDIYGSPKQAINSFGFNSFLYYTPNAETSFTLSTGLQTSRTNRVYLPGLAPVVEFDSETQYVDAKFSWKNLNTQVSYLSGLQDARVILPFRFRTWDIYSDYSLLLLNDKLRITPSFFYRNTGYKDTEGIGLGFISATDFKVIRSIASGLKADYQFWGDKMRFILGARYETFSVPNKPYWSYQAVLNYMPSSNHLLRLFAGRSNTSPAISTFLFDISFNFPLNNPPGFELQTRLFGNPNADLKVQDFIELGYRGKLSKDLQLDISLFGSRTQGFSYFIDRPVVIEPPLIKDETTIENIDAYIDQVGLTFSLDYRRENFQLRPFITLQRSIWQDFSPFRTAPEVDPIRNVENTFTLRDSNSPEIFGGFILNYRLGQRWNVNANGYFFTAHTIISEDLEEVANFDLENPDNQPGAKVNEQMLLNLSLQYKFSREFLVFAAIKNLLANDFQHYLTDRIKPSYLIGISFEIW